MHTQQSKINNNYDVFNVSNNIRTSIDKLIHSLKENMPFQFGIYGNNEKLKLVTKWKPNTMLNDGIKKMVDWYLNQ